MKSKWKSNILVFVQFGMILLMTLPFGTPSVYLEAGAFFVVLGIGVGVAALAKNKLGSFNIRPDIREDCDLIKDGVYAYVRHPMYSAVIISMFGVMLIYFGKYEVVLYAILTVNMLIKMFYEESLWRCHSDEYLEYSKNTSRLIPRVF
jgi:protein-S-isoprenylcysteine O-methyltransferase Ste14